MNTLSNKPKEVSTIVNLFYLELIVSLLGVYDEYDPMTESMYIFLGISIAFGLMVASEIKSFSKGDKESYNTIKFGSYIAVVIFFAITFLLNDESIFEYLETHPYFILFPIAGIFNVVWLNSKAVKNWFTG
jgi:hypothetical protein